MHSGRRANRRPPGELPAQDYVLQPKTRALVRVQPTYAPFLATVRMAATVLSLRRGKLSASAICALSCLLFLIVSALVSMIYCGSIGAVSCSLGRCPPGTGYTWCAAWKDLRGVVSFGLGLLVCSMLTRGQSSEDGEDIECVEESGTWLQRLQLPHW